MKSFKWAKYVIPESNLIFKKHDFNRFCHNTLRSTKISFLIWIYEVSL